MNITEKLDQLAEIQAEIDANTQLFRDLSEAALPAEVAEKLADIEAEWNGKIQPLQAKANELTAEVKADVLASGTTVKGAYLQAVYVKGRVSWDTSKLDVYAKAYPEIAELRREGEASVSIRAVK